MAEHIVDFRQTVEIDRQDGELLFRFAASLDHLRQRLQECGAVRQIGQPVVIGHMGHARLGLTTVGDILVGLDQILRRAGVIEHGHAARQEQPEAILGADRVLLGERPRFLSRRLVPRHDELGFALD